MSGSKFELGRFCLGSGQSHPFLSTTIVAQWGNLTPLRLAFSFNPRDIINQAHLLCHQWHSLPFEKGLLSSPVISLREAILGEMDEEVGRAASSPHLGMGSSRSQSSCPVQTPWLYGLRMPSPEGERTLPMVPSWLGTGRTGGCSPSFSGLRAQTSGSHRSGSGSQLRCMPAG